MANEAQLKAVISAVDKISGTLARITANMQHMENKSVKSAQSLNQKFNAAFRQLGNLTAPVRNQLRAVGEEFQSLGLKAAAIGVTAGFAFKKFLVDPTIQFERLKMSLEVIEGSAVKAGSTFAYLVDLAKRTPVDTETATHGYLTLKNAGIDPMNGSLQALIDYNSRVGGSMENLREVTRQLGQSWMKNKLQMEEVNVLTERMIPVIPLLAHALGKTDAQIMDMIHKSSIGRVELAKLFVQMGKDGAGAALKFSHSWEGVTSTLADTWSQVANQIMERGAFGRIKDMIVAITDRLSGLLTPPDMLRMFDQKGGQMPASLVRLQAIGDRLADAFEQVGNAFAKVGGWVDTLQRKVGGWGNLTLGIVGAVAAVMSGPLLLAVVQLGQAFAILGATLLANPIGLAIAAIATAALLIYKYWGPISGFFSKMWAAIIEGFRIARDTIIKLTEEIGVAIRGLIQNYSGMINSLGERMAGALTKTVDWFRGPKPTVNFLQQSRLMMQGAGGNHQVSVVFKNSPRSMWLESVKSKGSGNLDVDVGYGSLVGGH